MHKQRRSLLFWLPRVLGILFALFVSLFALDVFGQGYGFWGTLAAYLIHLTPVYALLLAVAIGWRWEWAGALLFLAFGMWYLMVSWGPFPPAANLIGVLPLAGPALLVALLFLVSWLNRRRLYA